jgi:hypothetical protein
MEDLTIVTCNHYTPDLISNLVKSIKKTCVKVPQILIVDTGDRWVEYQNNKKNKLQVANSDMLIGCRYTYLGETTHGEAVNTIMYGTVIDTRYILLVDSDVLFLQDISKPFERFKESGSVLMGEVTGDRGGKTIHNRVNPWFCFMDLKILREHRIRFYDHFRSKVRKSDKIYDIGSTMYEEILENGLTIADVKMEGKYFKHYEGMSWRVQKYNPDNGDTDIDIGGTHNNMALYQYGLDIKETYKQDVANL